MFDIFQRKKENDVYSLLLMYKVPNAIRPMPTCYSLDTVFPLLMWRSPSPCCTEEIKGHLYMLMNQSQNNAVM